jgi:cytochrome c6
MHRKRLTTVLVAASAALLMAWLFGASGATGQTTQHASTKVTTITVTAGKPTELSFKLSKASNVAVGDVTFKVTNKGALAHDFKVCTRAVRAAALNACVGKGTKLLKPNQTATLKLKLAKGKFEYLCTVRGHAAAGMKGLVGIGVKVAAPAINPGATTSSTPSVGGGTPTKAATTTAGAPRETLLGDAAAGAGVFNSADPPCGSCHTLRAAGATGNVGPNLDDIKPGQDLVVQRVSNGINVMPPYRGQLNDTQIRNLASYIYQSTHPA